MADLSASSSDIVTEVQVSVWLVDCRVHGINAALELKFCIWKKELSS